MIRTYPPGTEPPRDGERHGRLFVLVDGAVEVVRAGATVSVIDDHGVHRRGGGQQPVRIAIASRTGPAGLRI